MFGSDYNTIDEFKTACLAHETALDPANVIAKVYMIDELRDIAQNARLRLAEFPDFGRTGIGKRYELADSIAEAITPERIGEIVSLNDHQNYFQILSYAKMTDTNEYSSIENFISNLRYREIDIDTDSEFVWLFNGITEPAGRNCSLESILISEPNNQISFVYSVTRVMSIKDAPNQGMFNNMFLARVPLIVRFYFDLKLIEFSLPSFSEPLATAFDTTNKMPERFQIIINSSINHLKDSLGLTMESIDHNNLLLYLETLAGVMDMGWKIIPQHAAHFDFKQGVIPLKEILDTFSINLKNEIELRGITHPLSNINLYDLFRAIKEQSYTEAMVLKIPFGARGGNFLISVIYGPENSRYLPLVTINRNGSYLTDQLIESIYESEKEMLESPYNFNSLLQADVQTN